MELIDTNSVANKFLFFFNSSSLRHFLSQFFSSFLRSFFLQLICFIQFKSIFSSSTAIVGLVVLECVCASTNLVRCDFIAARHHTVLHHLNEYGGPKNVQITNLIKIDFHFDLFSSHRLKQSIIYTRPNVHKYTPSAWSDKRTIRPKRHAGGS